MNICRMSDKIELDRIKAQEKTNQIALLTAALVSEHANEQDKYVLRAALAEIVGNNYGHHFIPGDE